MLSHKIKTHTLLSVSMGRYSINRFVDDIYKVLTKLITRANELKALNNQKTVKQVEKKKHMEIYMDF